MMAGLQAPYGISAKDAFQDVSDTHPFHLPHIFNKCNEINDHSACTLNSTTLTWPLLKAGELWNQSGSQPLSAYELKSKIKSKVAVYEAAGIKYSGDPDKDFKLCANINKAAWEWAIGHAEASVVKRFQEKGEPMVFVDDKTATIGITGPEWIKDELVYSRVACKLTLWQSCRSPVLDV
jgi:hypothetical protein